MLHRALIHLALVAALLAPAGTAAADTVVAADPAAEQVTALGGTLVWVSGDFGEQRLMQRDRNGIAEVRGAPAARSYRSIDLGRDRRGRLVLTYQRCGAGRGCVILRDDLRGNRASLRGLTRPRCVLSTPPALWRQRAAYGLACFRREDGRRVDDPARSGLYVDETGRAPRRLPLPGEAIRAGATDIEAVDLKGTRVAAIAADIYAYAFEQTIEGTRRRSFLAAASEGESDQSAPGLSLGPRGSFWALTNAQHVDDPNRAIISRQVGFCRDFEVLENPPGPDEQVGFAAVDLAVSGRVVYLVVPGVGVVNHQYAPARECNPAG